MSLLMLFNGGAGAARSGVLRAEDEVKGTWIFEDLVETDDDQEVVDIIKKILRSGVL